MAYGGSGQSSDALGGDWMSFFRDLDNPEKWATNIAKEVSRTVTRVDKARSATQDLTDFIERGRNVIAGAGAGAQAGASTPVGENRMLLIGGAVALGLLLLTSGRRGRSAP